MTETQERKVYGYHNVKTNVMLAGYHQAFSELANPNSLDNRGRLMTFSPEDEEGKLDWKEITEPTEWASLCKKHNFKGKPASK